MELYKGAKVVEARNRKIWRKWLEKNHAKEKSAWLIIYHKKSDKPTVTYEESVEEALCFGWIDSLANKRDGESGYQSFAQRKPKSNWSKSNRERVDKLIAQKQMTPSGQAMIDLAKKTGTWTALIDIENAVVPPDLKEALTSNKIAAKNFEAFPISSKRIILEWIMTAKKSETRQKRIEQTIEMAAKNLRANHFAEGGKKLQ